jgi:glycosyltransferase involved in cell wall biosynthesis
MNGIDALVSVIMVVRNGARYIGAALDSVFAQTRPVHEVVVVDGHSTDQTEAIVRAHAGVRWIEQPGQGLADARNAGAREATGNWIAFLDHDDLWLPDKLERQFTALQDCPEATYVMGWLEFFADPADPQDAAAAHFNAKRIGTPRAGPTPGTVLVRRDTFEHVGPFDDRYTIGCDLEWIQRLRERETGVDCRDVVLRKRLHGRNLSRRASVNRADIFGILRDRLSRRD